jgi:hypothetical protein
VSDQAEGKGGDEEGGRPGADLVAEAAVFDLAGDDWQQAQSDQLSTWRRTSGNCPLTIWAADDRAG